MSNATSLLEQLTDEDAVWLLESNEERRVAAGEVVIAAGEPIDAMYLIFDGVLGVVGADGEAPFATAGAGEIVGEMSFVERETPSRTVEALEDSTVLVLSHDVLRGRAERDAEFAARLYRALAVLLSHRLRRASERHRRARCRGVSGCGGAGSVGADHGRGGRLQGHAARDQHDVDEARR